MTESIILPKIGLINVCVLSPAGGKPWQSHQARLLRSLSNQEKRRRLCPFRLRFCQGRPSAIGVRTLRRLCDRSRTFRLLHVSPIGAFRIGASDVGTVLFRILLEQIGRATGGTWLGERAIPGGEFTLGISMATEENAPAFASPLRQIPLLAFRTSHADGHRF